jgi:transcription elongation factor SPT5
MDAEAAKRHKKEFKQPPQRMFDSALMAELQECLGGDAYSENHRTPSHWPPIDDKNVYMYANNYFIDGFMYKEIQAETMCEWNEIKPTLDELKRFQDQGTDDVDDDMGAINLKFNSKSILDGMTGIKFESGTPTTLLRRGDLVRVMEGEQINLSGHVFSIDMKTDTIKLRPDHEDIHELMDFKVTEIQKMVYAGDHVKVLNGRYMGETGTTVKVDTTDEQQHLAIVLTDNSHKEIQVFVRDLQVSDEVAASLDQLGGYKIQDLVKLAQNSVGCIVSIGQDNFQIIDQDNRLQNHKLAQVRTKLNYQARSSSALDSKKNIIRPGDQVIVLEGPRKGITCKIVHMHKAILFVHSHTILQNGGIFVMRARKVVIAGQKLSMDLANSYISLQKNAGGRRNRDDEIIGKTVRITRGQHKGKIGIAVDASEKTVKIELHATTKFVSITREFVKVAGTKDGATRDPNTGQWGEAGAPALGAQTPMMGGQTPMAGGATPMVGAMTPSYEGDSNVWDPSSNTSSTPMPGTPGTPGINGTGGVWDAEEQGGTPALSGAGGYTPAMGGATPTMNEAASPMNGGGGATPGSFGGVATPGSPAEQQPSTPNMPGADGQEGANPNTEFVYVRLDVVLVTATDGGYDGLHGHIDQLEDDGKVIVQLDNAEETLIRIETSGLKPCKPEANDGVRVFGPGEYHNCVGKLVGIDGDDGIVRLKAGVLPFPFLPPSPPPRPASPATFPLFLFLSFCP